MPNEQEVVAFIEHYGTKGMKWGVRKPRKERKTSSDYKKVAPHKGKHASELTNKQLKAVNERMNLEANYNKLNPDSIKRGTVKVAAILATAQLAVTAYNMLNSPAAKAAQKRGRQLIKLQKRRGQQQLFF